MQVLVFSEVSMGDDFFVITIVLFVLADCLVTKTKPPTSLRFSLRSSRELVGGFAW